MDNTTSHSIQRAGPESHGGLITAEQFQVVVDIFVGVASTLSFGGVVTNSLNIRIFTTIGLKDSVTVSLFAMSLSDWCSCASNFVIVNAWLFKNLEAKHGKTFPISPIAVSVFSSNITAMCYSITAMITTFLAVARCLCVVKPLHFKSVFTRSRSIIINICFAMFSVAGYTAVLSQMGMIKKYDPSVNTTRIVIWLSEYREDVKDVVFLFYDTILSFSTLVIVIVCVIVMADSLRKTSRFRSMTSHSTTDDDVSKEKDHKLSGKELQVVKQVVLISVMYTVCSLPKMVSAMLSLVDPEFDIQKQHRYFVLSMAYLRIVLETFNSSSTFFIYYTYNSAFRRADLSIKSTRHAR